MSTSGTDGDMFKLTATEATNDGYTETLAFKANPDFEMPGDANGDNIYEVTVVATDGDGNTAEEMVTVKVTNIEEAGEVTLPGAQPQVDVAMTATLADSDIFSPDTVTWQWYRSGTAEIDDNTATCTATTTAGTTCLIDKAMSATYTPVDGDVGENLRAKATYFDMTYAGDDDLTTAGIVTDDDRFKNMATSDPSIEVSANAMNRPPKFSEGSSTERFVRENTDEAMDIGDAVTATDPDGETPTYSLGGADGASFDIDASDGQLETKADLDYETKKRYSVTVTATDSSRASNDSASIEVTIMVTNVDEAPMVMEGGLAVSGPSSVNYTEGETDAEATFTARGPMKDMATWTLEGDDRMYFRVSTARGVMTELMFRSPPDYEMPRGRAMSATNTNNYMVTLKADDGTYMDPHDVTVMVTNVEEDGTLTLSTMRPVVGTELTAMLDDLDGIVTVDSWEWARSMDMTDWENITGATMETYTPVAADVPMYLRATAMYTDGHGSGKTAMEMTDNMVTSDPMFPSETATRSVMENTDAGMNIGEPVTATDVDMDIPTYTLGGEDAASFDIDRMTGQLMTKAALDFEAEPEHTLTVMATDPSSGTSAMISVTIMVTDMDEAGTVTLDSERPVVGEMITANLVDPDAGVTGEMWQWASSPDMMTWTDIGGAMADAYTPVEADGENYLRASVSYTDIHGSDKTAEKVSANAVEGGLAISSGMSSVEYAENGMGAVGTTYMATGPNAAMATWSLGGDDANAFTLSNDGILMFGQSPDYETPADMGGDNTYMVTVMANDGTNDAMKAVTVVVTNVDDPGRVTFWRDGADATTAAIMVGDELGGAVDDSDGNPGDKFPIAMYKRIDNVTSWQWARSTDMTDWENIGIDGMYTVMDDDAGYYLRATATYTDGEGMGKTASEETMKVGAMPAEMTLLERYDDDKDGWIQLVEARDAVGDYFGPPKGVKLSLADTRKVVGLYFEYKNR